MKLYISGPISGYPMLNRPAFDVAAQHLRNKGHEPLNPFDNGLPADASWDDHLRADLRMLTEAEGVALLDNWQASRGACLEVHVAHALGLSTLPLYTWLPSPEIAGKS